MTRAEIDTLAQKFIITVTENFRNHQLYDEPNQAEYEAELKRIKEKFIEVFQSSQQSEAVQFAKFIGFNFTAEELYQKFKQQEK